MAATYISNPFPLLLKSMGRLLELNGVTALLLGLRVLAIFLAAYLVAGILILLHLVVLVPLVVLVGALYAAAFGLGVTAVLGNKSLAGEHVTVAEGWTVVSAKIAPLMGLGVILALGIGIGMALLIIPGVYLLGRWALAPYLLMNENLKVTKALSRSWKLTDGHIFEVLGMMCAIFILSGNGLLSFLVMPAGLAARYEQFEQLREAKAATPPTHWSNYALVIAAVFFLSLFGVMQRNLLTTMQNGTYYNGGRPGVTEPGNYYHNNSIYNN